MKAAKGAAPMTKEEKNELRNARNKAEQGTPKPTADEKAEAKAEEAEAEKERSANDPPKPTKADLKRIAKDNLEKEAEMAKGKEDDTDVQKALESAKGVVEIAKRAIDRSDKKLAKAYAREHTLPSGHALEKSNTMEAPPASLSQVALDEEKNK